MLENREEWNKTTQ